MVLSYKFHDDLDIRNVCLDVKKHLEGIVSNKDSFEEEYTRYKMIMEKSHNPMDRAKAAEMLRKHDKLLPSIRTDNLVKEYLQKIVKYIDTYNSLSSKSRVFGMDSCINIPKRVATIIEFLRVSSAYVTIKWECTYNMSKICSKCYATMRKAGQVMICDSCRHSYVIINMPHIRIDGSKIKNESTYKARKNYDKEYKHVCGTIHSATKDQKADIESYLYRSKIHEPTRDDIRNAIKMCNYSNYNDTNWLFSEITGEPLPPIDKYADITGERFELYHNIFRNTSKEGKNITNIHFLIRLFLWQEGIPYDESWFSSLSDKTRDKHRRNAKKICHILKQDFPLMNWDYPDDWNTPDLET